tara:strand:- start:107 stop:352 length:246 start_codon:yes stop_codon:yes gene_type:complete
MNNTMGDQNMLGYAGQDMAAGGAAGGTTNPTTGKIVPPSAPVDTSSIAMVNNKPLTQIGAGSKVVNNMEKNSNIPMDLRTA